MKPIVNGRSRAREGNINRTENGWPRNVCVRREDTLPVNLLITDLRYIPLAVSRVLNLVGERKRISHRIAVCYERRQRCNENE